MGLFDKKNLFTIVAAGYGRWMSRLSSPVCSTACSCSAGVLDTYKIVSDPVVRKNRARL